MPFPYFPGDHLGTTRYPCHRTTRRWPPVLPNRLNASELRRRLPPRSGGQGVAGSNPAVPTGNRVFSNIFMVLQEPAKEPSPSEMALLEACAGRMSRTSYQACAMTAEPGKPASRGVKHRARSGCSARGPVARVGVIAGSGERRPLGRSRRRWRLRRSVRAGWQAATATLGQQVGGGRWGIRWLWR